MTQRKGRPRPDATLANHLVTDDPIRSPLGDVDSVAEVIREDYPGLRDWQRTEFVHRLRSRRRNSRELDRICGIAPSPGGVAALERRELLETVQRLEDADHYRDMGFDLGVAERRAAGLAMAGWAA